jgi:endo-1,4-beta-xylanase
MQLDRRSLIAGGALALALPARAAEEESLAAAAARCGVRFGSAVGGRAFASSEYRALVERECAVITPENAMKWQQMSPSPDRISFEEADRFAAWAKKTGKQLRGHTLFWPREDRLPSWVRSHDFGPKPIEACDQIVGRQVATVAKRYAKSAYSFDVVNEAIDPKTGGYRESILSKASGGLGRLIGLSFQLAREAAPNAELVYNDYMDWGDWSAKHRAGVLRLLETLRKGDIPIDTLGIQAHINTPADPGAIAKRERDWRGFLDAVTGMGYKLAVTEFDVDDRELAGDIAARDQQVAAYGKAYAELLLSYPQCTSFVTWGLSDRFSWLHDFMPRSDGLRKRGCFYDEDFRPKPLRAALIDAFAAAPKR